jgi:hypothetical protein
MNYRKLIYYILLGVIILLSFFLYSSRFYPLLNSDDALNILIAHYYKLPNDLYCWGQDRGGTLIPLISQIFIRLFNCSALISVSLSNYIILILGFFSLSSLIKSNYYKIILAIIWFLPFQRFIDIVRFPIGIEYSLIGISIYLICKIENNKTSKWYIKHLLLISTILILILSVWVSDLAIVSIALLILILLFFNYTKNKRLKIDKSVLSYFLMGVVLCYIFIEFAKSSAIAKEENYLSFNSLDGVKNALYILKESLLKILTFSTNETPVSIYTCLVLIFIIALAFTILKKNVLINLFSNKWLAFFVTDAIVVFFVLLLSSWVLANGMGRWYFVATYISISMAIILILDNLNERKGTKILKYGILLLALTGSISTIYTMKYVRPKTLRPMVDVVGEFKRLGKIGVIAEYWNSYITSCPDPELVKATPNDISNVRNQEIVDMVFTRENIYVIKDMWMKAFPDTLEQFGYVLLKDGDQFELGGCDVCKYHKAKINKIFSLQKFSYPSSLEVVDSAVNKKVLFISTDSDSCKNKFILQGPYTSLGVGEFTVSYSLKADNYKNSSPIALLDVVTNSGTTKLAEKEIGRNDFLPNGYSNITLDFKTSKRYNNIEFRIYNLGNANLYFDHIVLKEK